MARGRKKKSEESKKVESVNPSTKVGSISPERQYCLDEYQRLTEAAFEALRSKDMSQYVKLTAERAGILKRMEGL